MKAVIPCAKKKDGMFPFSETKPTGLMPVMGTPIIRRLKNSLEEVGVTEFYLVSNHLEEELENEFQDDENVNIVHQEEISGTGSAVEKCSEIDENFFVVNGDVVVSEEDLNNLKKKFSNSDNKASVLAAGEEKPEEYGVLSIQNDMVEAIEEKPEDPDNVLVNTGIYIFSPEIFNTLNNLEGEEKSLTDAVRKLVDSEEVNFELVQNYWLDVGKPKKLLKADSVVREFEVRDQEVADSAQIHEDVQILGNAVIEQKAVLKPGVVLEGDVYIGKDTVVEPNTRIKNSSISHSSIVDAESVRDSLIFEENISDPGTVIQGCIMGEETNVRENTAIRESFIGARSYIEMNNSIYGIKFVPDARTDLHEISK